MAFSVGMVQLEDSYFNMLGPVESRTDLEKTGYRSEDCWFRLDAGAGLWLLPMTFMAH